MTEISIDSCRLLVEALTKVGMVPPNCARVVIDIRAGEAVRLFYEVIADSRIHQPSILEAIATIPAWKAEPCIFLDINGKACRRPSGHSGVHSHYCLWTSTAGQCRLVPEHEGEHQFEERP